MTPSIRVAACLAALLVGAIAEAACTSGDGDAATTDSAIEGGAAGGAAGSGGASGAAAAPDDASPDGGQGGATPDAGADGGDPFAGCERPPPFTLGFPCTVDALCSAMECGAPSSPFDDDGCMRKDCVREADCATGERCLPGALVDERCIMGYVEQCWANDTAPLCECGGGAVCSGMVVCVPTEIAPQASDCGFTETASCAALYEKQSSLVEVADRLDDQSIIDAVNLCKQKVEDAYAARGCTHP